MKNIDKNLNGVFTAVGCDFDIYTGRALNRRIIVCNVSIMVNIAEPYFIMDAPNSFISTV